MIHLNDPSDQNERGQLSWYLTCLQVGSCLYFLLSSHLSSLVFFFTGSTFVALISAPGILDAQRTTYTVNARHSAASVRSTEIHPMFLGLSLHLLFLSAPCPLLITGTHVKDERAATLHRIDIRGTSQRALVFSTPNGAKTIQLAESGLRTESIALYGMKL